MMGLRINLADQTVYPRAYELRRRREHDRPALELSGTR